MRLNIRHRTVYRYDQVVRSSTQYLRLTPLSDAAQRVESWGVRAAGNLSAWHDGYGNLVHTLVVDQPHQELLIEAQGVVETHESVTHLDGSGETLPRQVYLRHTELTALDPALRAFARPFAALLGEAPLDALLELMFAIRRRVEFDTNTTHSGTLASEAFAKGSGVCQDHAHIFIACCRAIGVPARYVGGYLLIDGDTANQVAGHAWAEAWVDKLGWVSFDVANNRHRHSTHVRVAVGLDYRDVCPVAGVRSGGGMETLAVEVQVVQQ